MIILQKFNSTVATVMEKVDLNESYIFHLNIHSILKHIQELSSYLSSIHISFFFGGIV